VSGAEFDRKRRMERGRGLAYPGAMRTRDAVELVALAALWGASFLFMRVAAPDLGPVPLMFVRVGIAALCLLPAAALGRRVRALRGRVAPVAVVGAINSALPFCLLAYATLHMTSGMAAILNATSPLWGGLVAHLWLRERLTAARAAGLAIGVAGVAVLVWGRASLRAGGAGPGVIAALLATLSYGVAASYTRKRLAGVDPVAVAAGSQLAATLLLAPAAFLLWPAHATAARSWGAAVGLGVACTAVAYVLYFRLIAHVGPARAIAVTFLVPPFALLWGGLVLGERLGARTLVGAGIVLAGTALATGLVRPRAARSRAVTAAPPSVVSR
jgi:drug/metabolite transporter (DMT)-like permease